MANEMEPISGAVTIDMPCDTDIRAIYEYWDQLRDGRPMPARADIDPTAIPKLLPYLFMYNVLPDGTGFTIRLVGEELIHSAGSNPVGQAAGSTMTPQGAEMIVKILCAVVEEQAPKFRAGRMYWHPKRPYRHFEACLLPLSSDGQTVDIIFGGVKMLGLSTPGQPSLSSQELSL